MLDKLLLAESRCGPRGAWLAGLAGALVALASAGATAETGPQRLRCTNSANGANWQIVVDPQKRLVDGQPATIGDSTISWRNGKGAIYRLDRATGKLQLSAPSTTGGFFLHYSCATE